MDNYRSKGSKRNYEQQNSKQQREKRKSNFNYDSLNLNTRVNFISGGNNKESKNDNDDGNPSPPPPPQISSKPFEFHDTPQLKGIGGKLLLQMGYEPGKGLGKNLQGIQVPIQAKPRYGRGAIGAYGPENINSKEAINAAKISRGFNNINKQSYPDMTEILPNNLILLTRQISSMQTLNENINTIEIDNNIQSDLKELSWNKYMIEMRSMLLENFGYDPKNDSKLLMKPNFNSMITVYNSTNQNSKKNMKKEKQAKIKITKVSDCLKVAVIDKNDPEGKIRNIQHQEVLREALDNALFKRLDESPPNLIPSCHWSGFKDDIFKIICEDEQSIICIEQLVKNVGNLWYDAHLCLVDLDELFKLRISLNRENKTNNPALLKKMFKKLSREFDQNWRESERNTRRLLESVNLKPSYKNTQINNNKINLKGSKISNFEKDLLVDIQSVPESLKIAIIDKNDVEGKIRNADHQSLLNETLYKAITKICEDPNITPRYYLTGFKDNIFQIICYDEQSKICMEEIMKNVGNLWEGSYLVVVSLEEVLNIQQTSASKYNPFESEFNKISQQYNDIWQTNEQLESEELKQIRNKSYTEPKDQTIPKGSKNDVYPSGFLINIRKISNQKFKRFEFKAVKESIELFIYETIKSKEFFPQFENITINCENVYVNCANLSTQEWFSKSIIPKFTLFPPWQNAEFLFDVINNNQENILEKRVQAKIWFPGLKFKSDDYLEMLQAQNNSLDTTLWSIINRKDAIEGVHLYITIDKLSALILNSINKRLYFGSGRVEVKF